MCFCVYLFSKTCMVVVVLGSIPPPPMLLLAATTAAVAVDPQHATACCGFLSCVV